MTKLAKVINAIKNYPMSDPSKVEIALYGVVLLGILWLAKHPIS